MKFYEIKGNNKKWQVLDIEDKTKNQLIELTLNKTSIGGAVLYENRIFITEYMMTKIINDDINDNNRLNNIILEYHSSEPTIRSWSNGIYIKNMDRDMEYMKKRSNKFIKNARETAKTGQSITIFKCRFDDESEFLTFSINDQFAKKTVRTHRRMNTQKILSRWLKCI